MKKILLEAVKQIMGENNQSSNGDLYLIPEDGGQPIKINGIAALSEIQFGDNSYENEQFAWRDMQAVSCSVTMTNGYARILNRFARRVRRYIRRHKQQTKRKSAKERKRNSNQTELLS